MTDMKVRFPCCNRTVIFKMNLKDNRFKTICYRCWKIHDGVLKEGKGYTIFKSASLDNARIKSY